MSHTTATNPAGRPIATTPTTGTLLTAALTAGTLLLFLLLFLFVGAQPARASEPPVKEIVETRIPGFADARSVAGGQAPAGNIYVTDQGDHRVEELTATGTLIAMFGWDVNKTKTIEGKPQTERNICTTASTDTCQAGVEGTAPGQVSEPESIAVDQTKNDDFYVAEILTVRNGKGELTFGSRVQELTSTGAFVLEIGKEVNQTTKANLCTQEETEKSGVTCTAPRMLTPRELEETPGEPGSFKFAQGDGDLLAVGGPEDLLYVGTRNEVQEFRSDGSSTGEPGVKGGAISGRLAKISDLYLSIVKGLAVDAAGNVYVGYSIDAKSPIEVLQFDRAGVETNAFPTPGGVLTIATDPAGRLAVVDGYYGDVWGQLFEVGVSRLHLLTEFPRETAEDVAFNGDGYMYAVASDRSEIVVYRPVPVGELVTVPLTEPPVCAEVAGGASKVTFDCTLKGMVNPEGVSETEVWFRWARSEDLSEKPPTPVQAVTTGSVPVGVSAGVEGVRPHESLYYDLAGYDHNVKNPELLTSELALFRTPAVAARIIGEPEVSFVRAFTAVMSGELDPENATTEYSFEYGPCAQLSSCPVTARTQAQTSDAYTPIETVQQASALQPATEYSYRLLASNEGSTNGIYEAGSSAAEGHFTTAPAPVPQAITGPASEVTSTAALIAGTTNPDGQPSTYSFEMGVSAGAATQYGLLYTASAGSDATPTIRTFPVTGLQPGTQYTYRILVHNEFGTVTGEPVTFTTDGLASELFSPVALAILTVPSITIPNEPAQTTVRALTRAQRRLANALKACAKKPKRKRAACERNAHKKYAAKAKKALRKGPGRR